MGLIRPRKVLTTAVLTPSSLSFRAMDHSLGLFHPFERLKNLCHETVRIRELPCSVRALYTCIPSSPIAETAYKDCGHLGTHSLCRQKIVFDSLNYLRINFFTKPCQFYRGHGGYLRIGIFGHGS